MSRTELTELLKKCRFYHVIRLAERVYTEGVKAYLPLQEPVMKALRSLDCRGKRVLDIGCRDGLFSFEAEKLGAREVNGIENDLSAGAVPDFRETQMEYTGGPGDTGPGST